MPSKHITYRVKFNLRGLPNESEYQLWDWYVAEHGSDMKELLMLEIMSEYEVEDSDKIYVVEWEIINS